MATAGRVAGRVSCARPQLARGNGDSMTHHELGEVLECDEKQRSASCCGRPRVLGDARRGNAQQAGWLPPSPTGIVCVLDVCCDPLVGLRVR